MPIQVLDYTEQEFESCYQYYMERKWLQHEKGGAAAAAGGENGPFETSSCTRLKCTKSTIGGHCITKLFFN